MIKNNFSKLLGEKRLNQTQFSRLTGIRRQTISDLYYGINISISMNNLDKICEVLQCDVSDIFEHIPRNNFY